MMNMDHPTVTDAAPANAQGSADIVEPVEPIEMIEIVEMLDDELLVEEISIDGMCGVY